jgi:tyrosinase
MTDTPGLQGISRRAFLATGLAMTVMPSLPSRAQGGARFRRKNASDPGAAQDLASYRRAVEKMLALPPSDPRNWYRQALIHIADCPHANWWFLPWHRAYLGWFEEICRDLSGDPDFALPYWDWTAQPQVPADLYVGVLDPTNAAFVTSYAAFKPAYEMSINSADWWVDGPDGRFRELLARGMRHPEDLWFDLGEDPRGGPFFDRSSARGLPKSSPDLDADAKDAVRIEMITAALNATTFVGFGSPRAVSHHEMSGYSILEGQAHNWVHLSVGGALNGNGGFMQANLSPVDPVFFLHHCNIDRLWDVWTRKQLAAGGPIHPPGAETPEVEWTQWDIWANKEAFLFFVDKRGNPVAGTRAGEYAQIGPFDYDYQPGSGEALVQPGPSDFALPPSEIARGEVVQPIVGPDSPATATVPAPISVLDDGRAPPNLYARVTIAFPAASHRPRLLVLLNPPDGASSQDVDPQHVIGRLAIFGHHGPGHGPVSYLLPLTEALGAQLANQTTDSASPLEFALFAMADGHLHGDSASESGAGTELISVTIEAN